MNKTYNHISKFIEKHNAHIQLLLLISLLVFGVLFPVIKIDMQTVIYSLILIVGTEILLLLIRNETLQDKINCYLCNDSNDENLVSISVDEDSQIFPHMLSQVEHDLFISGITCNNIWAHISKIKEILHKGYKIRILISAEGALQSNTLIFKGNDLKDYINNMKSKIELLLNTIVADEQLKNFFDNKILEIKTTQIPFTVVYVATNIYGDNVQKQQIKVTQYIPKHERAECPNIIIDSVHNNKLFNYYVNSIKDLWKISAPLNIQ